MFRTALAATTSLGLLLAALALAPIVLAGDPCFHRMDNRPAVTAGGSSQVVLGDCAFTPTVNEVAVGTTVTWRNGSSQAHEVVGSNLTWGAPGKLLQPGDTIGFSFAKAGVYAYSCMLHPGMTGTIVVGDTAALGSTGGAVDTAAASASERAAETGYSAVTVGAAGAGGLGLGIVLAGLIRRRRAA